MHLNDVRATDPKLGGASGSGSVAEIVTAGSSLVEAAPEPSRREATTRNMYVAPGWQDASGIVASPAVVAVALSGSGRKSSPAAAPFLGEPCCLGERRFHQKTRHICMENQSKIIVFTCLEEPFRFLPGDAPCHTNSHFSAEEEESSFSIEESSFSIEDSFICI